MHRSAAVDEHKHDDRVETLSILRESTVTVFVNSVAGGGRARFYLTQIQKLFDSFHIHEQFVMTKRALERELCAQKAISQGRRARFKHWRMQPSGRRCF